MGQTTDPRLSRAYEIGRHAIQIANSGKEREAYEMLATNGLHLRDLLAVGYTVEEVDALRRGFRAWISENPHTLQ